MLGFACSQLWPCSDFTGADRSFIVALKWSRRRTVKNVVIVVSQADQVVFFSGAIYLMCEKSLLLPVIIIK